MGICKTIKLKNRRITLINYEDGDIGMKFKRLNDPLTEHTDMNMPIYSKNGKVMTTNIKLSLEAAKAIYYLLTVQFYPNEFNENL